MINLWARVWKTTTTATTTTVGDCNDGKNLINSLHTHRFNQQTSRAEAAEAGERNEKLPSRLTFWHRRRVTAECGVGVAAGGKNCQSSPRLSANLKRPLTAISGCHVCLSRTHTGKLRAGIFRLFGQPGESISPLSQVCKGAKAITWEPPERAPTIDLQ